MSFRPTVPPRRNAPAPPSTGSTDEDPVAKPMSIADRIAHLKLGQARQRDAVAEAPETHLDDDTDERPPHQVHRTLYGTYPTDEELASRGPAFLRAINRKPPVPPSKAPQNGPPARRLPPMPARLPTPESEPDPDPDPEVEEQSDEGYYSQDSATCLCCHDFSAIDHHAAEFPRERVQSVAQLAHDLTEPWESETEKFRAIFTWMHYNIVYDTKAFFSGNIRGSTAESTLRSGLAVCDGYAGLFVGLAEAVGLQAHRVTGHGKGFGYKALDPGSPLPAYQGNHAWNCILMDGSWHLIDSCWGAGALSGSEYTPRFTPMWFTSSPAQFGARHYPEDPSYQLMSEEEGGPRSWADYILVPDTPTIFGPFYELSFDPGRVEPSLMEVQSGSWVVFSITKQCEHMSRASEDNWVYFISLPDDTRTPLAVDENGDWSAQVYVPQGSGDISLYYVTVFDRRDAKSLTNGQFVAGIGRKAMEFGGLARWRAI